LLMKAPDMVKAPVSIWGMDNPTTQIAVSIFMERFLDRAALPPAELGRQRRRIMGPLSSDIDIPTRNPPHPATGSTQFPDLAGQADSPYR
jgi:hypothetical protein